MGESNAELARRGYESASGGDFGPVAELLAENVEWHGGNPSEPEACHNRGEALEGEANLTANLTTFRDGKAVEKVHYPSVGDALAAVGLGTNELRLHR